MTKLQLNKSKNLKVKNIKNLNKIKNLKNLTRFKKLNIKKLIKSKKSNFIKVNNFFGLAFFIFKTRLAFF